MKMVRQNIMHPTWKRNEDGKANILHPTWKCNEDGKAEYTASNMEIQ
jgi:hypothetical protein